MKKRILVFASCILAMGMVGGCSRKEVKNAENRVNRSTEYAADQTKKGVKKGRSDMEESIDSMMNYLKEEGIVYNNMQTIEQMDFAAHEGRSFEIEGNRIYLYRVKSDDENMKKLLQQAEETGRAKVRIDNSEKEYIAQVNGDFLMLYDSSIKADDLQSVFPNYGKDAVTETKPNDDSSNHKNE